MKKIRAAVVGYGNIGRYTIEALRAAVRIGNKEAAEQICASSIGVIESNNDNALVNPGV